MNKILRLHEGGHLTIRHGGLKKWLERENQLAEVKANQEKQEPFNAPNVGELFLQIKRKNILSVYL